jgi:polysaccharide export outer membrane protein
MIARRSGAHGKDAGAKTCRTWLARCAFWMVLLGISVSGCGGSPAYNWKAENALGYRIGPGDVMKINVWKHDEVSQQVTVRPDGAFSLPLVGDVAATGRSAQEIAADVQSRLAKYYQDNPPVTVQVTDVKSYKIYVVGEVTKPGEFSPTHQVTVLMGLSLAGGFTRFASPDRIVIVRKDARGVRRIPFDYSAVVEKGDLQQDITLQLGDTVIVP